MGSGRFAHLIVLLNVLVSSMRFPLSLNMLLHLTLCQIHANEELEAKLSDLRKETDKAKEQTQTAEAALRKCQDETRCALLRTILCVQHTIAGCYARLYKRRRLGMHPNASDQMMLYCEQN